MLGHILGTIRRPFGRASLAGDNTTTHAALRVIREEHATLAAMLQSLMQMVRRGPVHEGHDDSGRFFDALRAMLLCIDGFPETHHHPKASDLLFPRVVRAASHVMATIERLERDPANGEARVRKIMHLLLAWALLGEARRPVFIDEVTRCVAFYLEHTRQEETTVLPEAERHLNEADWHALNAAFATNQDPLNHRVPRNPQFDRLFTRTAMKAPAPVGLGH